MRDPDSKYYNPNSHDAVLSRIETTVEQINDKVDEIKETQADQQEKIHEFDKWKWWVIGAGGGLGAACSAVIIYVPKLLNH